MARVRHIVGLCLRSVFSGIGPPPPIDCCVSPSTFDAAQAGVDDVATSINTACYIAESFDDAVPSIAETFDDAASHIVEHFDDAPSIVDTFDSIPSVIDIDDVPTSVVDIGNVPSSSSGSDNVTRPHHRTHRQI